MPLQPIVPAIRAGGGDGALVERFDRREPRASGDLRGRRKRRAAPPNPRVARGREHRAMESRQAGYAPLSSGMAQAIPVSRKGRLAKRAMEKLSTLEGQVAAAPHREGLSQTAAATRTGQPPGVVATWLGAAWTNPRVEPGAAGVQL